MTQEEIRHFKTLGFIQYKRFFSPEEVDKLSSAFDSAMEAPRPQLPGSEDNRLFPFSIMTLIRSIPCWMMSEFWMFFQP